MVDKMSRYKYAPLLVFQIFLMVLYIVFTTYGGDKEVNVRGFEDTHVMIFIGFAFLMTFLKKYCYSAIGFNWFLAALVIQWALLCQSFFHMKDNTIFITKKSLLEADIMSATVLITFGALLGLASGTQLLFIAIIETAVGCINLYLMEEVYKVSDIGGSIAIHTYGAYFGLGVSTAMRMRKPTGPDPPGTVRLDGPSYASDVTSVLGSIFLWIFWPSFNSGLASSDSEHQRAVINTYLALAAATVTTFVLSAMVNHKPGKIEMEHVQNSTLAGGVAVGAVANMFISPGVAIAIGIGAGFISVFGYRFLSPKLQNLGIQDTCGVNNLHGIPGVCSGLLSVLFAALATSEVYGAEYADIFPAIVEDGRSPANQALYQLIALVTTLVLSFGTGLLTGFIAKIGLFTPLAVHERYDDELNWDLP
ncbi:ammonium transporter Rh type B [Helicoverpa zea]|uniref:ammonium transporter Rh type B n=1 Tax=Helicoverpa zea TaxID=7113 RepID=UPI001F56B60B|nr:ammonium transporter Rh type B [Helicoverpa zea]XP_047028606.1 ammonium transporter Rh type B [Helicoverpa zea]